MYLTIDIGGTKTLVAVFNEHREIVEKIRFETPADYAEFKQELSRTMPQLQSGPYAVGAIGTRGLVDRTLGHLKADTILSWKNAPLVADASQLFDCHFVIENDAKLAGLSEGLNVLNEFRKVLYLTISTGIGGAYIVDGVINESTQDAEVGKCLFTHNGQLQTWESFAAGKAIVATYGKQASELEDPQAWEVISQNLAIGILNLCATYTPDALIFGGGVGSHYQKFSEPLNRIISDLSPPLVHVPRLFQAAAPEEAVLYGCYEYAKQHA